MIVKFRTINLLKIMLQSQMNFIVKDILYYWYIVQKEDGNSGIQAH